MPVEIIVSIAAILGSVIGAIVTHLLSKNKNLAEIEKIRAETDKAKADAEKTRAEILGPKAIAETTILTDSQEEKLIQRVVEKVQTIQEQTKTKSPTVLYQPPSLSERLVYLYAVRQDIENSIRQIVFHMGGGWPGSSSASFGAYFEIASSYKLISENLVNEINDFYYYTQSILNAGDLSDYQFLQVQYLAANIHLQLDHFLQDKNMMLG